MSTRTVVECDRCRHELRNQNGVADTIRRDDGNGDKIELCKSCSNKLTDFLNGKELEEPP